MEKIEFGRDSFLKTLIIIDPQNDFIKEKHEKVVDNIVKLIKEWDGFICVTQDTHINNAANYWYSPEGEVYPPHCIKDTDGWKIDSRIEDALYSHTKVIFEKNVFGSAEMIDFFQNHIKLPVTWPHFYICGFVTDICVLANAILLRTFYPYVKITLYSNLCAGYNSEAHESALKILKSHAIEVKEWKSNVRTE